MSGNGRKAGAVEAVGTADELAQCDKAVAAFVANRNKAVKLLAEVKPSSLRSRAECAMFLVEALQSPDGSPSHVAALRKAVAAAEAAVARAPRDVHALVAKARALARLAEIQLAVLDVARPPTKTGLGPVFAASLAAASAARDVAADAPSGILAHERIAIGILDASTATLAAIRQQLSVNLNKCVGGAVSPRLACSLSLLPLAWWRWAASVRTAWTYARTAVGSGRTLRACTGTA